MAKRGQADQLFSAIRLYAVRERPYFATALFALQPVKTDGLGTFAVDKYARVYWDSELFDASKLDARKKRHPDAVTWKISDGGVGLIHELGHWLCKHFERSDGYLENAECKRCVKRRLNLAQDLAINCGLKEEFRAKVASPNNPPALLASDPLPEHYTFPDHLAWEQYYEMLSKKVSSGHVHGVLGCGSAAHGIPEDYELPAPTDANDVQGIRDAEADLLRKAVAKEVQREAQKNPGSVSAGWQRWADGLLQPPQVPWQQELAALVRSAVTTAAGMVDYCYVKPSRRGTFNGVVMPAMRRPKPDVAIVIDTSGSMAEEDLRAALAEINGIVKALGQHVVPVICCDAEAAPVQYVTDARAVDLIGGGGTNMGVGIAAAERIHSDVCVVLTDGYTPWPQEATRCQLVVGVIRREGEEAPAQYDDYFSIPDYVKRVVHIRSGIGEEAA